LANVLMFATVTVLPLAAFLSEKVPVPLTAKVSLATPVATAPAVIVAVVLPS
jgi:hypothetical protein